MASVQKIHRGVSLAWLKGKARVGRSDSLDTADIRIIFERGSKRHRLCSRRNHLHLHSCQCFCLTRVFLFPPLLQRPAVRPTVAYRRPFKRERSAKRKCTRAYSIRDPCFFFPSRSRVRVSRVHQLPTASKQRNNEGRIHRGIIRRGQSSLRSSLTFVPR